MNRLFVFYLFFITFNFTIAQPGHIETFGQSTNGTGATLMTNSNNALSGNGQRKIYHSDIDDTYHLVYESDGKIYYSRSTGGDNWGMPEIVSSSGDSYFPSIAIENDIVIVVWFEYLGSVGRIELRERSYGIWQPKVTVATFSLHKEQAIKPTVISHGFIAHVLWKDPDHNDLRFRGYDYSSDKFRGGEISVPNTNSDSKNPTIEMSLRHGPGVTARINLAWEEKGHIYYSRFLTSGLGIVLEVNKSQVSVNTEYTNHRNPSISVNYYDNPSIIWQAYAGVALEKDVLLHRISSTGISWNVVLNVFSTNESDVEPSLAGQPNVIQSRLQQTSWANDANQLWVGHYDGVSWTSF